MGQRHSSIRAGYLGVLSAALTAVLTFAATPELGTGDGFRDRDGLLFRDLADR